MRPHPDQQGHQDSDERYSEKCIRPTVRKAAVQMTVTTLKYPFEMFKNAAWQAGIDAPSMLEEFFTVLFMEVGEVRT